MPVVRETTDDEDMPWPPDGFTGEWIVEWPNGAVKFRSLFLAGKREGDYCCYWPNGKPAQLGYSSDGMSVGLWTDFREDGTKLKETHYTNKKRTFKTVFFGVDGAITKTKYKLDGKETSKEEFERYVKGGEPGVAPNGGPAQPSGNSEPGDGPPSGKLSC